MLISCICLVPRIRTALYRLPHQRTLRTCPIHSQTLELVFCITGHDIYSPTHIQRPLNHWLSLYSTIFPPVSRVDSLFNNMFHPVSRVAPPANTIVSAYFKICLPFQYYFFQPVSRNSMTLLRGGLFMSYPLSSFALSYHVHLVNHRCLKT